MITPRPEHHRRPQRVHLDPAADRHAERRRASVLNTSYTFKAEVEVPQGGGEGMLITQGGRFGGYGFYVLKGKPVFLWNLVDLKRIVGRARACPRQAHAGIRLQVRRARRARWHSAAYSGLGQGGTGVLKVDGKVVATQKMERQLPLSFSGTRPWTSAPTPARRSSNDADYKPPFAVHRQDQQDHPQIDRPEVVAGGHQETRDGAA